MKLAILTILALALLTTAHPAVRHLAQDAVVPGETCLNVACVCNLIKKRYPPTRPLDEDAVRRLSAECDITPPGEDEYCYTLPELGTIQFESGDHTYYIDYVDLCEF